MSNTPLILVVDDHPDMSEVFAEAVNNEGFRAIEADSGERALEIVARTVPDAIILDWMMPGMNGLEVLQALKREPTTSGIPVVVASALSDAASVETALAAGATEYWVKTRIDLGRVGARLCHLLGRKRNHARDT